MARDYKNAGKKKAAKTGRSAFVSQALTFATGLCIGLFVALYIYLNPQGGFGFPGSSKPTTPAPQAGSEKKAASPAPTNVPAPKFDFYKILPNREVNISEWVAEDRDSGPKPESEPGLYVLQVGSYKTFDAADEATATLALLGIDADIQRVVINGQDVRHRVRIGPFSDPAKFDEVRQRLKQNGMSFMVLKLKVDEAKKAPAE